MTERLEELEGWPETAEQKNMSFCFSLRSQA